MVRFGLFTESYDPVINGVSTSVRTLATELSRAGHQPVVVAPAYPGIGFLTPGLPGFREATGSGEPEVYRILAWRTPLNPQNPFAFPPLVVTPRALRGLKLDIVHTQQPFGMGLHGRATARRLGVPLVSTFHTLYTEYSHYLPIVPRPFARRYLTRVLHAYYSSCDAVIVPSREAGNRLEQMGVDPGKLHVIPTGVPDPPSVLPIAVEQARSEYKLPPGAPVLLFVGRLAREKNLALLVDAFAALSRDYGPEDPKRPILLLVGSGPGLEDCQEQVRRLKLDRWTRFAGFLRRDQLAPLYAAATIFAFPSATETQGVVLSEAQSHGLPCVIVKGGGAPEFVRPEVDALVVEPTIDAFTTGLRNLLGNEERRLRFSAAARESPLRPTPAGMARQVAEVYRAAGEIRHEAVNL